MSPPKNITRLVLQILFWSMCGVILYWSFCGWQKQPVALKNLTFSEFLESVEAGWVANTEVSGSKISGEFKAGGRFTTLKEDGYRITDLFIKYKVPFKNISDEPSGWLLFFSNPIIHLLLAIIIFAFIWGWIQRYAINRQGGGMTMGFGKAKVRQFNAKEQEKVTFQDVAGIEEAKEEVMEIVDYLNGSEKYSRLGGRVPKGVLLVGKPGTGKTLLARAVAGEADVPFFSISGSDFVEMFVGVGASRVRDLFDHGRKNSPCIIFIDELDAVGRQRGTGMGGGNDEREQTLNQILVEMDGFAPNSGVILLGATNRPDILDPAFTRAGRFDRHVIMPEPDIAGRLAIIRVHVKKKKLAEDVDLEKLARMTPKMVGADIENFANEAALAAGREESDAIYMRHFEAAVEKQYLGKERRSLKIVQKEQRIIAVHEAGHAIVNLASPHIDPLHKITIVPRGIGALGVTQSLSEEERYLFSKIELIERMRYYLGGRAAEEIIFSAEMITAGAENDLKKTTFLARKMVAEWGMDEEFGMAYFGGESENPLLGKKMALHLHSGVASGTEEKIDNRVRAIIAARYKETKKIIVDRVRDLQKIATALLERETLSAEDVKKLLEE